MSTSRRPRSGWRAGAGPRRCSVTYSSAEIHRYGVTVVTYTWAMLCELVEATSPELADHHPIRLFIGAGMPIGLWHKVADRFAPARVLEFYASPEGDAVLANVAGTKTGAKGRPLPGSAEIRLGGYGVLTAATLTTALGRGPLDERPTIVHIVDRMPLTPSYRPLSTTLREAGLPAPGETTWYHDFTDGQYRQPATTGRKRGV